MESPISSFTGEFSFLSNFHPVEILYGEGGSYPSVEHAYQAAKTLSMEWREKIRHAPSAGAAKRLGRRVPLVANWEIIRIPLMVQLIAQKFYPKTQPELAAKLLATGTRQLIEGNSWGDTFWGICNGNGANHLGKILMEQREIIREEWK